MAYDSSFIIRKLVFVYRLMSDSVKSVFILLGIGDFSGGSPAGQVPV